MITIKKFDLYSIIFALILALIIIGGFWSLEYIQSKGQSQKATAKTPTHYNSKSTNSPQPTSDPPLSHAEPSALQGIAKLTEKTTVQALVLGDAIATSQGASNPKENSWHVILSRDLQSIYPSNLQWTFKATQNATCKDILALIPNVTKTTDIVFLCFGRNDWKTFNPAEFETNCERLFTELRVKNPKMDIILLIEPPVKSIDNNNRFYPIRSILLNMESNYSLTLIDGWSAFINAPTPLDQLLADDVNPNDLGYQILAKEFLSQLKDRLSTE